MKKPSIVIAAALLGAFGCKSKPAEKKAAAKVAAADGGAPLDAAAPPTLDAAVAAAAPPVVVRELVVGDASLPEGQLAHIGSGWKFTQDEMITQLELTADGPISAGRSFVRAWDGNGNRRWQSWTDGQLSRFAISPDGSHVAIVHSTLVGGRLTLVDRAGQPGPGSETERVEQLAWSADGKRLVLAGPTVAIHDGATAAMIASVKKPAIAAAFAADGTVIFVAKDGVYRWTGAADAVPEAMAPMAAPPTAAFIATDAATIVWSDGKAVTAFDVKTKAATPLAVTAPGPIVAVKASPDGKALAVSWKGGLRIFDLGATPAQRWERTLKLPAAPVVGFGNGGKTLAVSDVGTVTLSDAATGGWSKTPAGATFKGFTPASFAVVAAADGTAAYDLSNGLKSAEVDDRPVDAPAWVEDYAYDGKGTALGWASGSTDPCAPLKLWIAGTPGFVMLPKPPKCPGDDLDTWQVGPSLVSNIAGEIFEPESKKLLVTLPSSGRPLISLSTSSDRSHAVAVYGPIADSKDESDAGTLVDEFQVPEGTLIKEYRLERGAGEGGDGVTGAVVVNDGTLYIGCKDGAVYVVWRGAELPAPAVTMDAPVTHLEQSPSGGVVAVTDADDRTIIFGLK